MAARKLLKWLNPLLGLLLAAQCLSLVLMNFWPQAMELHRLGGGLLLGLALIHLYLNRAWIRSTYFAKKG